MDQRRCDLSLVAKLLVQRVINGGVVESKWDTVRHLSAGCEVWCAPTPGDDGMDVGERVTKSCPCSLSCGRESAATNWVR